MTMYIEERPGPARTGVWAILHEGQLVGKIIVAYPRDGAGRLYLALWDWTGEDSKVLTGWAGGYGYDKVANILKGMTFGGVSMKESHWERDLQDAGYKVHRLL